MNPENKNWYVYIVRCSDDSLYTGISTDVEARIAKHNKGMGAKYTRSRGPVDLVYTESLSEKGDALRREMEIKKLSPQNKRKLVAK
ncbi:MAG: GIY-YIG nuclease family protein [Gammaproteobacteria bacterium]|nr:GIY-YIG nuclease family protein [Gammaproteobacteria bacterium]